MTNTHKAQNDIATPTLQMPAEIAGLNLEAVKFKLVKEEGWSLERCDEVEQHYKGFLSLVALFPQDEHVPTADIDEMWHTHILDTRKYMADCFNIFGAYIHHYPYMGLMGEGDKEKAGQLFVQTVDRFAQMGIDLRIDAADCGGGGGCSGGSSCSSGNSSSCSSGNSSSCSSKSSCSSHTPSTPGGIWPFIASCSSSPSPSPSPSEPPRRKETPRNDNRGQKEKEKKRGWLPRLRFWEGSVNPQGFGDFVRPDRAAVEALAAEKLAKRVLN